MLILADTGRKCVTIDALKRDFSPQPQNGRSTWSALVFSPHSKLLLMNTIKPVLLSGWIIEIRYLPATNHRPARIKALCAIDSRRNQRSLTRSLSCSNTTEEIKNLVVDLIEKHNLNFLRNSVGKMSLATLRKGWIVSLPVWFLPSAYNLACIHFRIC